MKLSLAWHLSLLALAARPRLARGDGGGGITQLNQTRWSGLLGGAGGPHPQALLMRSKPRLSPKDQSEKKVVIVGAGYAGWGAAQRLVEGGMRPKDITILEADVGFGGRAQRDEEFAPFPLDLGPSYVPDHFRDELAELSGVPVGDLPLERVMDVGGDSWIVWRDGMTYNKFLEDNIIARLDACGFMSACREQATKMGFDYKKDHGGKGAHGCFSREGEAYWGGGTEEQQTGPLSGSDKRINCDRIKKEYGCRVTSVDYTSKRVVTACEDGRSFKSTQVIVTVPLSVLKDGDIDFAPALPAGVQENVDERDWWGGFKLFLEFDTDFDPYGVMSFDGAYVKDPVTGVYTGEHYMWDYTRYSAADFKGERNVVGGYFIGSKADEFDGMSEAQIVARVLEKFEDYYNGEAEYYYDYATWADKQRGYSPGSYKRHLLVNWQDPEVKPYVRGTHSAPNPNYAGHRSDDGNKLFLAGEAFPAPRGEFCSSPFYCYHHKYWEELTEEIREAYGVLGWDLEKWNTEEDIPDTNEMFWDDLTGEQREAVTFVGYTQESWDGRWTCPSPEECYHRKYWDELPEKIQEAYGVLGWDQENWDTGEDVPDTTEMTWDELKNKQQEAAAFIGYTPQKWDANLEEAEAAMAAAQPVVEYEEEGWVYTALHSGQKAAETILALDHWSDLLPMEDFGTHGGFLGVFHACGKNAQVKEKKSDFYLSLKGGDADSCARTKHLALSRGATKIQIDFKLKVRDFKEGDYFSVEIAANGGGDYVQVLNAGTDASGESGMKGYVEIPEDKKWFRLEKLLGGGKKKKKKKLVVKLKDLGVAGGVDRISLQFGSHATKDHPKVYLDDVVLQEFVPM